jgi:membrane protein DedA with SNARE-associated domain
VSLHEVAHLVHHYGYGLVFAATALQALGLPVPGGTAIVAAALYAGTDHGLNIVLVIAAGALGALAGASAAFALGRWRGETILLYAGRRLRQSPERVQRMRAEFAARGGLMVFIGRFITGLRNVVGLLGGATGMPFRRFVAITAVAATVWALINGLEYYYLGHALAGANTWVQIVLVCAGVAWLAISLNLVRRRMMREVMASRGADS